MVLNILDICLEIALMAESVKNQGHQEFLKEFYTILMPLPVALMLGLDCLFSSRRGLGLHFGVDFFQLALQLLLFGLQGLFLLLQLLSAALNSQGHGSASPRLRETELTSRPLTLGQRPGERSMGQVLARFSTMADLVGRSASRKSTARAKVFTEALPTGSWAAIGLLREPPAEGDLSALLEAVRSSDLLCQATS
ncbi:hypothetical protein Cgig2_010950 [Carnegiea gigantea]|uniref:Uncharacterized protein n=1 Tax=Carnegiea gigantea TaxID=171969 RepID=A0A9Q1K060_9CARY|nr:hypothetical protein Cgig2_010950 [Carnegiea gigantea]